jgi:hypothetical protein
MQRTRTTSKPRFHEISPNTTFYQSLKHKHHRISNLDKPIKLPPWEKQLSEVRTQADELTDLTDNNETANQSQIGEQRYDNAFLTFRKAPSGDVPLEQVSVRTSLNTVCRIAERR